MGELNKFIDSLCHLLIRADEGFIFAYAFFILAILYKIFGVRRCV